MIDQRKDRAMGAIIGSLIGDSIGMGCHWYYNIEEQERDCGTWISDFQDPSPSRQDTWGKVSKLRHDLGLRSGDLSQTGEFSVMLLESLYENKGVYKKYDFTDRVNQLLKQIDGTSMSGRFTDRAIRDLWKNRAAGISWDEAGSDTDTGEAAIRAISLVARNIDNQHQLVAEAYENIWLTHNNSYVAGQSLTYALAVEALIQGIPLTDIRTHMSQFGNDKYTCDRTVSPDIRFQIGNEAAQMGANHELNLDPVVVCRLFGMNCTLGFMLPAAYFLIHRYPKDFEMAVLTAINAGGNNMARAALVGGLSGALVGLSGIPERFVNGLQNSEHYLEMVDVVAN